MGNRGLETTPTKGNRGLETTPTKGNRGLETTPTEGTSWSGDHSYKGDIVVWRPLLQGGNRGQETTPTKGNRGLETTPTRGTSWSGFVIFNFDSLKSQVKDIDRISYSVNERLR